VDFVCLSGFLWEAGFTLDYKDFQLDSAITIWEYLEAHSYDFIISTYSPFFEEQDLTLLQEIKRIHPKTRILLLANHRDRLEPDHPKRILSGHPFIFAMVYDYAHHNVASFMEKGPSGDLFNVLFMKNGDLWGRIDPIPRRVAIPVPRHDLFISDAYFHYDSVGGRLTSTMSSFGCRQQCPFCWGPKLYPAVTVRTSENLISEMEHIASCGIQEVYFNDLTFAYDRKTVLEFCRSMIAHRIRLRWFCSSRFDLMTAETIEAMAQAGCRCIEFGLESGNYPVRKLYGKDFPDSTVDKVLRLCKSHGIHTSVFIILGLPEETLSDMQRSIDFVLERDFDYLSLNVLWAEPFTAFDRKIDSTAENIPRTQYAQSINFKHPHASSDQIEALYRRSFRRFYLDPGFMLRQIGSIRSLKKIRNLMSIVMDLAGKDRY